MGLDSVCDTGLILGLSLTSSPSMVKLNTMGSTNQPVVSFDHFMMQTVEPSLTLSLSGNHHDPNKNHTVTGCSSFSNMSAKREREVGSEESERFSNGNSFSRSGVDDVEDDDGCVNGRKKLRLTKPQSALLEEAFKLHSSLNPKQKQELAMDLKLRPRQVEVWFQNRRARTKLKQTEMDLEHLKKQCDKLTFENQKLEKELQEVKALKSTQPFYMQLPAATGRAAMCPLCERIRDTKSSIAKNPFTMAVKPHFFNSLITSPSAAC